VEEIAPRVSAVYISLNFLCGASAQSHASHSFLGHIDHDGELGDDTEAAAVEAVKDGLSDEH